MEDTLKRNQLTPGEALLAAGLARDALPYLLAACEGHPKDWRHLSNLGSAYRILGDIGLAKGKLLEALGLNDKSPEVWNNLSNVLDDEGDFENSYIAAVNSYRLMQSRHASMCLGAAMLRRGEWAVGGRLYDGGRIGYSWVPINGIPVWNGEDVSGKRVLVLPEGGYGDSFFALPFMKEMVNRGAEVTYLVWDDQMEVLELVDFPLKTLPRSKQFDGRGFDFQSPTLSLLFGLGWKKSDVTPISRIMNVWEEERIPARKSLANGGKPKIGICWSAEESTTSRKFRSIPVSEMMPLAGLDCRWINLTMSQSPLKLIEDHPHGSWTETASLISELDAVVTVDTAVAHLAGCLGVRTFIIVPLNVDWKWGIEGESSTWYASATLIRNTDTLSFQPAVEEARSKLNKWLLTDSSTPI